MIDFFSPTDFMAQRLGNELRTPKAPVSFIAGLGSTFALNLAMSRHDR